MKLSVGRLTSPSLGSYQNFGHKKKFHPSGGKNRVRETIKEHLNERGYTL